MGDEINIIKRKNGNVMLYNGHQYYKHKQYKKTPTCIWTCSKKRSEKCSGSVTVNDNMQIVTQRTHTCVPKLLQNEMSIVMNELRNNAQRTDIPIPQIYDEALSNWQQKGYNLVTPFPNFEGAKHSLYDSRNKAVGVTKLNFKNFDKVQVPMQHSQYVVADYYDGHTKILVFCMEEDKAFINDIKEVFGDSTFPPSAINQQYKLK